MTASQRRSAVAAVRNHGNVGGGMGRGKADIAAEYLLKLHELSFTSL